MATINSICDTAIGLAVLYCFIFIALICTIGIGKDRAPLRQTIKISSIAATVLTVAVILLPDKKDTNSSENDISQININQNQASKMQVEKWKQEADNKMYRDLGVSGGDIKGSSINTSNGRVFIYTEDNGRTWHGKNMNQ